MTNDLTPHEPGGIDDDGFHGPLNVDHLGSNYLKWTAAAHWVDRDGLTPPSPLLVFAIDEALRMWKANQPTIIRDKPLPDLEQLNASIPRSEWERGIDGQPRKPWEHIVIVRLVNPGTGEIYKYEAATTGAHIAYDKLKESVMTTRMLRGTRVMPIVLLSEKPMKTNYGMGLRPHFEIVDWKIPGGDAQMVSAKPTAPQLTGPTAASVQSPPTSPPTSPPASPSAASAPATNTSAQPYEAKPKPPVNLAGETLTAMGNVKPVTTGEIMDDEVPW
jgi:hypothetical protein